jgi:type IV pilus assembly protein PilC
MDILETQAENPYLKEICKAVAGDIRSGSNLHRALAKHPASFPRCIAAWSSRGETSGALPQILQRLIYIITHEYKVRTEVRSVLQYPLIVLGALIAAFVSLIMFVIPKFSSVYARRRSSCRFRPGLPALSRFMNAYWPWLLVGLAVLVVGFLVALRTRPGRFAWDRLKLNLPLVGPLLVKAALSRFASIFSILQASGVASSTRSRSCPARSATKPSAASWNACSRAWSRATASPGR